MFHIMAAMEQMERDLIQELTRACLKPAPKSTITSLGHKRKRWKMELVTQNGREKLRGHFVVLGRAGGYSITGIENSPPSLMPEGQRAVTVLVRV